MFDLNPEAFMQFVDKYLFKQNIEEQTVSKNSFWQIIKTLIGEVSRGEAQKTDQKFIVSEWIYP